MKKSVAVLCLAIVPAAFSQNRIGTGAVRELYEAYCLNCHGQNLEGGLGQSLVDDLWIHGSSDEDIARVIRNGVPDQGMVPMEGTLDEEQIRSLVIFIREQKQLADSKQLRSALEPQDGVFKSQEHSFRLEEVGKGDGILWALEFLPDSSILATQRDGQLWRFSEGRRTLIQGTPEVWQHGQGGLLEVQKHPKHEENGWIYLAYSENTGAMEAGKPAGTTCVVRGRIRDDQWVDQEKIFNVPPQFHSSAGSHYGTRFVFQNGYLYFGIGDRGRMQTAQDLSSPNGKIHRIHDDGRLPEDNPFVNTPGAYPSIWSLGHRNPQGLDAHPVTGEIWEVEHGPRGGDETNLIQKGLNYGWPVITYGMNYNGSPITALTQKEGMEQPIHYWNPSIAICGIDFYEGDKFPKWKNSLFVSGLASEELHRLEIDGNTVVKDEIVMAKQGRIRDVYSGPDGYLYVLLVTASPRVGSIYRLVPVE